MTPESTATLKRGDYAPSQPGDLRSPCPAINALANHGYLPRDGRNVRAPEFLKGMDQLGLSSLLGSLFTHPIFLEKKSATLAKASSWWSIIANPYAHVFAPFGLRQPGQKDSDGVACLNLDDLAAHNVIEHDISLTRLDFAQGDNCSAQPQLIEDLLASSSDGKTITMDDFAQLRRRRYSQQKKDNSKLEFGAFQNQIACGEVALILSVFGNGKEVPVEYVKTFFQHARLPRDEGWLKRRWWTLGLLELNNVVNTFKRLLGPIGEVELPVVHATH